MNTSRRHLLVVGAGYVGLVTAVGLAQLGHTIHLIEKRRDRLDALREGRVPIHETGLPEALSEVIAAGRLTVGSTIEQPIDDRFDAFDAALVCVGTPIGADGRSDLSQLQSALLELAPALPDGAPLVIRSTLPPGSTTLAVEWADVPTSRIFTNPEFLRQGTALADFRNPTRIVIGRFPDADPASQDLVMSVYDGIEAPRLVVDVSSAELIKNGANAFLALKLSFANEIASLSEEYGADVEDVLAGITLDPRIGPQYMRPSFGFGGSCLPKELQALATAGAVRGLSMHVTIAASDANAAQQARFADRISTVLGGLEGRTIGLLGLAFKAGTDDVRDSPALAVAARLLAAGATVQAYDPEASSNAARELPGLVIAESPAEALRGADAAVIGTEWPEFQALDWGYLKELLARPIVIDGRRIYHAPRLRALGLRYEAIGSAADTTFAEPIPGEVAAVE
jgi:UDPglucose 6-dehydrogenase